MDLNIADAIVAKGDYTVEANTDDIFFGLDLLRTIDPEIGDGDMSVGYDAIYIGDWEYTVSLMSEDQFLALLKRGWFEDDKSWCHPV